MSKKAIVPAKRRTGWRFVTLSDGRRIVEPPAGGTFTKAEIRAAVRSAVEKRLEAEAG
ncbi:MAG: hypothetical protein AAFY34_07040 [Pseudomonadota bacterium]